MAALPAVPAAQVGTINTAGVRKGIFENTVVNGRVYTTRLDFVNVPCTIVHGSNAGFGSVEIYDFSKSNMLWKGLLADLVISKPSGTDPATGAAYVYALTSDHDGFLAFGTTVQTNSTPPASTRADLAPSTAYAAVADVVASADVKSATASASLIFDGTGTAKTLNFNMVVDTTDEFVGSVDNSVVLLNGTVQFIWEDGGALD